MIGDPRIAFVSFTGSVEGGHAVQQAASTRFISAEPRARRQGPGLRSCRRAARIRRSRTSWTARTSTPVSRAARSSASTCIGTSIATFVDGFVALTRQYRLGNPLLPETTLGPMVRTARRRSSGIRSRKRCSRAPRTLIDPREFPAQAEGTPYMAPQVLVDVDHRMRVMTEETFGPVVGLMAVADDDEAIALMNDSRYGLTASIWTTRCRRGDPDRRSRRDRHLVSEPVRLSRSGAGVDRRQGLRPWLLPVPARVRGPDPPEVVPPAFEGVSQAPSSQLPASSSPSSRASFLNARGALRLRAQNPPGALWRDLAVAGRLQPMRPAQAGTPTRSRSRIRARSGRRRSPEPRAASREPRDLNHPCDTRHAPRPIVP